MMSKFQESESHKYFDLETERSAGPTPHFIHKENKTPRDWLPFQETGRQSIGSHNQNPRFSPVSFQQAIPLTWNEGLLPNASKTASGFGLSVVFLHCSLRPISSKAWWHQTQIFTYPVYFKNSLNEQIFSHVGPTVLNAPRNLTRRLLAVDKIQHCSSETPSCYCPLGLSDPEMPHRAAEECHLGPPLLGVPFSSSPLEVGPLEPLDISSYEGFAFSCNTVQAPPNKAVVCDCLSWSYLFP